MFVAWSPRKETGGYVHGQAWHQEGRRGECPRPGLKARKESGGRPTLIIPKRRPLENSPFLGASWPIVGRSGPKTFPKMAPKDVQKLSKNLSKIAQHLTQKVTIVGQILDPSWDLESSKTAKACNRQIPPELSQKLLAPRWPKITPKWSKMVPRWPKTAPRWAKRVPMWPQDGSWMASDASTLFFPSQWGGVPEAMEIKRSTREKNSNGEKYIENTEI